jgi:hypothetical protein
MRVKDARADKGLAWSRRIAIHRLTMHRNGMSMLPLSRSLFDHETMSLLTVSVAAALLTATIIVVAALTNV